MSDRDWKTLKDFGTAAVQTFVYQKKCNPLATQPQAICSRNIFFKHKIEFTCCKLVFTKMHASNRRTANLWVDQNCLLGTANPK
jgi:hypothetical protein